MNQRTWAITLIAVLLAGSAVALATNVAGQDYERQGEIVETGSAYAVDWDSEDAGKLRLSLDPADSAADPSAQVSVFEDGARQGTYTLDEDWPRLDQRVEPSAEIAIVVHRALESEIDVLAEEGHEMGLERLELSTQSVELVEGDNEAIRTQVALDVDRPLANLALNLDGDADDLQVTALNEDDETVLEAQAATIDTSAGQQLVATLSPSNFEQGSMLVRVQVATLNGTLSLEKASLEAPTDNVVQVSEDTSSSSTNDTSTEEPNDTQPTNTSEDAPASQRALTKITELEPETPTAVEVPAGVEALHIVADDDCVTAVVYGPDDSIVATKMIAEDEGAREWNGSDEDHSHKVVDDIPVDTTGEHVVFLDGHDEAELYMRLADGVTVDHRELEVTKVEGETSGNESRVLSSDNSTANATLDGGLVGFSWHSNGADAHREVRLLGPDGQTVYESEGVGASHLTIRDSEQNRDPLVGPDGEYTIETESRSVYGQGISYTLFTYER